MVQIIKRELVDKGKKGKTEITIPKQMLAPNDWCWDDGTLLG